MQRVLFVLAASLCLAARFSAQAPAQPPYPYHEVSTTWARLRTALDGIAGWPIAVPLPRYGSQTVLEAIEQARALRVAVVEAGSTQRVSTDINKPLDTRLTPQEIQVVAAALKTAGLQLRVYAIPAIPADDAGARAQFELARTLGASILAVGEMPDALPRLEDLAAEYGINVAVRGMPSALGNALRGRSQRVGVYVDLGQWLDHGIRPLDGLSPVIHRLQVLRLVDRDSGGRLGTGSAGIPELLDELRRANATPTIVVDGTGAPDVQADLARALSDFEQAVRPAAARRVAELARAIPIKGRERLRPAEREQVAAAVPATLAATPKRPRRLLVFDANIGYGGNTGGHRSIGAATMLLEEYGRTTGAYEAVFSNDVDNFRYETLRHFDAVFLNNTAGIIFVDQDHRDGLVRFIREGGGLAAYHGASHASMDWPEFRQILGAVGGGHKLANEVATVRIDDPASPVTAAFEGRSFVHSDEFYRFTDEVLSRERVHALMSIDVANTDMNQPGNCSSCERADQDYILSWIRSYGKGRVFYTSLGHNPSFFMNETMNRFFLAGIQFALGDLEADTMPRAPMTGSMGR